MSSPTFKQSRRRRLCLSSDTTNTLPEYNPAAWQRLEDVPFDRPPDYPDSAEEADADTDDLGSEEDAQLPPPPPLSPAHSPRRIPRRTITHRKHQSTASSSDAYLDTLLERSVHALEMSNALLQSSMTAQTSISSVLSSDTPVDHTLCRAQSLSAKIGKDRVREHWVDELREISQDVEQLFEEDERRPGHSRHSSMSMSLPNSSPIAERHPRRRPSLDACRMESSDAPHLRLSGSDRTRFISPAPKAMTVYIGSTDDPNEISLPSTLGLRTTGSHWRTPDGSSLTGASSSAPKSTVMDGPSSLAYNILASFKPHTTSTSSSRSSSRTRSQPSHSPRKFHLPDSPAVEQCRGRSSTPRADHSHIPHREITTCIEESEESPSSSSTDSPPHAKHTIQSLRKILSEQAATAESSRQPGSSTGSQSQHVRLRKPQCLLMPPPVPSSGTSTATASISRLFTKPTHSSSTRPRSPPRQSSMKRRSAAVTPEMADTPNASTPSIPDSTGVRAGATRSGGTTPKRISFAELPKPYAGAIAEGRQKKRAGISDKDGRGKGQRVSGEDKGWLLGWLLAAMPPGPHPSGGLVSKTRRDSDCSFDEIPM